MERTGDGDFQLAIVVDEVAVPIVGTSGRGGDVGVGVGVGLSKVSTTSSGLPINRSNPCSNSSISSVISGAA